MIEQVQSPALSKIKKLLKLSASTNQHEAELAATRAQELMLYYEIDLADIDLSEDEDSRSKEPIEKHEIDAGVRRRAIWKGMLANQLAQGFGCRMYWQGKRTILVGRRSQTTTVDYLYQFLVRELKRLATEGLEYHKAQGTGVHGKTWKNNFYLGAVGAIGDRLTENRVVVIDKVKEEGNKSQALIRLDEDEKEVETYYKSLGLGRSISVGGKWSSSGRSAGQSAGRNVNLSGGKGLASAPGKLT